MFAFSSKTEINKPLALDDIFKTITISKEAQAEAKTTIASITLKNVLSPETLYCSESGDIKEIYVFDIRMKAQYVPEHFIKALDDGIQLKTLFNVWHEDAEFSLISLKYGVEKGKYLHTHWEANANFPIPHVESVGELYIYLLSKFLPYPAFEEEDANSYVARNRKLIKLDSQIATLSSAISRENISRRKLEYNAKLRECKAEREKLI